MWNSLPLPFVCEIHKLKCPPKFLKKHTHLKRCLYYNHLPHNPISAAHRQKKILQKRSPCPDWVKTIKIPMLMSMTSTLLGRGMRKDQNLASSSKNCCRSDFFRPLLARLVERSVQTHIFITKAKTTVSFEPRLDRNLWWWSEQPPQNIW